MINKITPISLILALSIVIGSIGCEKKDSVGSPLDSSNVTGNTRKEKILSDEEEAEFIKQSGRCSISELNEKGNLDSSCQPGVKHSESSH